MYANARNSLQLSTSLIIQYIILDSQAFNGSFGETILDCRAAQ